MPSLGLSGVSTLRCQKGAQVPSAAISCAELHPFGVTESYDLGLHYRSDQIKNSQFSKTLDMLMCFKGEVRRT